MTWAPHKHNPSLMDSNEDEKPKGVGCLNESFGGKTVTYYYPSNEVAGN